MAQEKNPNSWSRLKADQVRRGDGMSYVITPVEDELGNLLERRYPQKEEGAAMFAMMQDLGLGDYNLVVNPQAPRSRMGAEVGSDEVLMGEYDPGDNRVKINKGLVDPRDRKQTIFHELAHFGDQVEDPTFNLIDQPTHFKHYPKGEETMLNSIIHQKAIEQGFDPDPQAMSDMPWLKQVAPLSSNKLANPWAMNRNKLPAEMWNVIRK